MKGKILLTIGAACLGSVVGYSLVYGDYVTAALCLVSGVCVGLYIQWAIASVIRDHKALDKDFKEFKQKFYPNE